MLIGSDLLRADTVHQRHAGHVLRWDHPLPRQLAHPVEGSFTVGVRVLFEGDYPQPGCSQSRDYLPEPPPEDVGAVRVLEAPRPFDEPSGRQPARGLADVVAHALFEEPRSPAGGVGVGPAPLLVEHIRNRMKLHEHEAPAGFQDGGDALRPGLKVGEPADYPIGREDGVEAPSFARRCCKPIVDVGANELGGYTRLRSEAAGVTDSLVAYVHAGDSCPEQGQAQGVAAGVALEVRERLSAEVSEQRDLLGEEGAAALPEEPGQVSAVAIVRAYGRVPREPILISEPLVIHDHILNRPERPLLHDLSQNLREAGGGI